MGLDKDNFVEIFFNGFEGVWKLMTGLFGAMFQNVYGARRQTICSEY